MSKKSAWSVMVVTSAKDIARFDKLLGEEHYLGKGQPVGDFIRQVVLRDQQWVGCFTWGASSYALQDRDEWIGWTPTLRAARLKLIVQNRRFLIPAQTREPNVASQVLAAAIEALPEQWLKTFGYSPVLAETFTDIELFHGTCYRAAQWIPVGQTKGYGRYRADFYRFHGRPKKLWLKPLGRLSPERVRDILCGPLPAVCEPGAQSSASGLLPIPETEAYSLFQALHRVHDPRRKNRRFRCGSVLSIVAMALLSGCRDVAQIHRFGQRLKQKHRARIGLPRNKKHPKLVEAPSYHVYYNLLAKVNLDDFAQALSQWLQAGRGRLPTCLALDGKMIRNLIGVLSFSEHETGVPMVVAIQTEKKGDGEHCELEVGKRTLAEQGPILDGDTWVTGDALHTQKPNAMNISDAGGHYLFQVCDNRRKLRQMAVAKAAATPLLPSNMKNPSPDSV